MTEQLPDIVNQNAALLRAIADGPSASLTDLASRAETRPDNLNRKLKALEAEGVIVTVGASHEVVMTPKGDRALLALAVFAGTAEVGGGSPAQIDVPADLIDPNPHDPRIVVDLAADAEMARSVADKGILQRVLVRPNPDAPGRYQQALGHRRVRAARAAGVPVPIEIRDLTDDAMAEIGIIENVQRSDLHWMDEAEGYLMLHLRGKSAAQIQQLVGAGGRKKRSIQEMIQFARELDDDAKRRARLPEGDPERISVDQARALVGNKRPRPTLDLSPTLTTTLLELLSAGEGTGADEDVIETVLHSRPTGGALIKLSDRGLIKFRFDGNTPLARIPISEDVARFMRESGFYEDPRAAVNKARAVHMGDLAAGALDASGEYFTPELNLPAEIEDGQRREPLDDLGGPARGEPMATAPQPSAPDVSADSALAILELAHKIARWAMPGEPLPSVAIDPSYRNDPLSNQLVFARLIMFQVVGAQTAAALTPTAQAWLDTQDIPRDDAGRPVIEDEALAYIQAKDGRELRGDYITPWLTLRAAEAQAEGADAHAVRDGDTPRRDAFMQNVLDVAREHEGQDGAPQSTSPLAAPPMVAPDIVEAAILRRVLAAVREVTALIAIGRSRKIKPEEDRIVLQLLDVAVGEAEAALAPRMTRPPEAGPDLELADLEAEGEA